MTNNLIAKDALDFSSKSFALTDELKHDLETSKKPSIILVVGPARSGKSTLCNIVLNPVIHSGKETFETQEGNRPVTMQIQYVKVNLSDILKIHNLDINLGFDSELLIFDCEGIDSLDKVTESLRKAIFTFMQISTINIYVSKTIDRSNIFELKSFFSLPQLIGGSKPLSRGSAIVLTDIGVPGNPSESEYEEKRKSNDEYELNKILSHLDEKHIKFTKENIAFFAQPKWSKEKHYFESINDLIRFIVKIISNRFRIPGTNLIQIFEKCIPIMTKLNDLDDPNVKLDEIVNNLINEYFHTAYEYAIQQSSSLIQNEIECKTANELIELSKTQYFLPIQEKTIQIFQNKANEIFPSIIEYFPDKNNALENQIKTNIEQKSKEIFEKRCQIVVIPFISDQVINKTKEKILIDLRSNSNNSMKSQDISELIIKYQNWANNLLDEQLRLICSNLISSTFYTLQIKNNNSLIAQEVIISEQNERIKRLESQREDSETKIQQLFESLKDMKQKIAKIHTDQMKRERFVGSFYFSTRNEDKLPGALKCNGQKVNVSEYPTFVEKYLKPKLVATVSIERWNQLKETTNNVGFFGYDDNGGIFIAPFIPSGTFLSNSQVDTVNGTNMAAGSFVDDQIVNITGSTLYKVLGIDWNHSDSGALSNHVAGCWSTNIRCNGGGDDWNRILVIDFNASRSVRTGDRVMPKTIFHNLFIIISENE